MADCIIEVGHMSVSREASWLMDGDPEKPICDRHKRHYETAFDDYSHIVWVPIPPSPVAARRYAPGIPSLTDADYDGQDRGRMDPLAWAAMCIVNHLFDMAGVTVDVRQRINDEADAYVLMKLRETTPAASEATA